MAKVSTYLNFDRETEAAFTFYKSVFGTEFDGPMTRYSEIPPQEGQPPVKDEDRNLVMHVALPTVGGHILRGTDAPRSMGFNVTPGNNSYIMLELDSRADTDRLFDALAEGGTVEMGLEDMFWGEYFGSLVDKFGVQWMFSCASKE
jgi:PhnB protein